MSTWLWILIAVQMAMGSFDVLYHHELLERLAWRPSQRRELLLHGARNSLYAVLFVVFGWLEARGAFAWLVIAILTAELGITLADFVEEDSSRKLPASERVTHTLLALNYGAILVLLVPVLLSWVWEETDIVRASHGFWSVLAALAALGVALFGLRDFAAALRAPRLVAGPAASLVATLPRGQTILVTGATGFIGSRFVEALSVAGHSTIILTRNPAKTTNLRPPFAVVTSLDQIPSNVRIDAIVSLAGEPIGDNIWTKAKKRAIVQSRAELAEKLLGLIARLEQRPSVLVTASAIGWYGLQDDEFLTEASGWRPCFSHEVCALCEREALKAERYGLRVALLRIGLVLGTEGGILSRLLTPFEFGVGGPIGSGRQWMSWITRDDLVRLIAHVIATPSLEGPINATAPEPVRNSVFARELGHALHRPAFLRLPAAPLRLVGGDFAKELLLGGQRVIPREVLASGFAFRHVEIADALASILGSDSGNPRAQRASVMTRLTGRSKFSQRTQAS